MTDTTRTTADEDRIIADGLSVAERLREQLKAIEAARDTQPERLALARAAAEVAREDCLAIEAERWASFLKLLPTYSGADGDLNGVMFIPGLSAKGIFGTRLAFDVLSHIGDADAVNEVMVRYYRMTTDPAQMFLIVAEALKTIAEHVMPSLFEIIEEAAGCWDVRVGLADAARNAWQARMADLADDTEAGQ